MTSVELELLGTRSAGRRVRSGARARRAAAAGRERARRSLNVTVAAVGLLLTAPLMVVIGALVRLSSKGPILYRQPRIGLDRRNGREPPPGCRRSLDLGGRPFNIHKFRTMYHAGGDGQEIWASPDDPRVTPIGRILRKYRLDELPQLFNVLRGDMNIVGPRPEQPSIFVNLRSEIDGYQLRQTVPPGITGWAQINHHYDRSVDDVRRKVELDLEYIRRCSVGHDLAIMLRTLPVVVFKKGAW